MDKIRVFLATGKKYHFWILCAIVLVVGLLAWTTATGDLANRYQTRRQKLDEDFKGVRAISAQVNHPNDKVIDAIQREGDKLKEKVLQAWELLYNEQNEKNRWPDSLSKGFLRDIKRLAPDDEIPGHRREEYQTFIAQHFPKLFKQLDIRRRRERVEGEETEEGTGNPPPRDRPGRASAPRGGGMDEMGGPMGMMGLEGEMAGGGRGAGPPIRRREEEDLEMEGVIEWDESNRLRIEDRYYWDKTPSTLQVRYAQEDLWVYETLLRIIVDCNKGSNYYNAAVRTIEALQIGRDAAPAFGKVESDLFLGGAVEEKPRGGGAPGGGAPRGEMGGPGMGGDMMGEGGRAAAGGPGRGPAGIPGGGGGDATGMMSAEEKLVMQLKAFRYLDQDFKPMPDDNEHPYAEFKMMGIILKLVMKEQKVPEVLAGCANSNMPIEIRQVRLNPGGGARLKLQEEGASADTSRSSTGMGMGMEMGMGRMGGEMDMFGGREGGGRSRGPGMSGTGSDQGGITAPYMPVEFLGVIYIYNPPDRDKLGTGTVGEKAAAKEPAAPPPAAAPAAQPATPPPAEEPTPPAEKPAPPAGQPTPPAEAAPAAEPATPPVQPATPAAEQPKPAAAGAAAAATPKAGAENAKEAPAKR